MSIVWAFLGPLLFLSFLTGTLIYVFKKKFNFQFLLPITVVATTLFVYFFTFIFHHISAGIILVAIAAIAFIPLFIIDKDRKKTLASLFFTPAFIIFVLLYIFLFLFHYNTLPQLFSDDNMHWAPQVWTMWLRDDFYTSPNLSIVTHGDYPPILQLFQLIFVKVAGTYREGLLYVALEITSFAMLFPVLKNLEWKKGRTLKTVGLSLLILLGFMALPTTLDVTHLFYNALHPDYAIAFVFVAGVVLAVIGSRKFSWVNAIMLSLIVTFLCLTKQASVLFGGLVGLIYVAGLWHSYRPKVKKLVGSFWAYVKKWRKHWASIVVALVLLFLPLVGLKLWTAQTKGFQAPYCCVAIFHVSPTDALKVPDVLLKKSGDVSQQNYARGFFRYVLTYQTGFTTQFFSSVSYTQFILLFVGIMAYVGYNYKDKFKRSRLIITGTIIVAGWFVYLGAIYLTFLFGGMIDSERDNLLTGDRYLRTYIFGMLLILFLMLVAYVITKFNQNKKMATKTLLVSVVVLAGFFGFIFNTDIVKNGYVVESLKFRGDYTAAGISNVSQFSQSMRTFTQSLGGTYAKPKSIAVTTKGGADDTSYFLRYLAIPNRVQNGSDLVLSDMKQADVCNVLKTSDFLYIGYAANDKKSLALINGCITNHIDSFIQYQAFKIEKDGDKLTLIERNF